MFTKLTDLRADYIGFSEKGLDLDEVLQSPYTYEQNFVKSITPTQQAQELFNVLDVLNVESRQVIKIEGYEKHSKEFFLACARVATLMKHTGPVTCHLFKSPEGAKSFPEHTDPDTVVIHMLKGVKLFKNTQGDILYLQPGDFMLIPANYPHEAVNVTDNLMLSIGLESFNVEKL
jgi:uncharacterized RmlC-like cupin family protein